MKDRNSLRKHLKPLLIQNCINSKLLKEVKADLLQIGILGGTVQDMFTQRITIEQISDDVLYYLAKSMFKSLKIDIINPNDYYMKEEIEEIKRIGKTILSDEDNKLPFQFTGVHKISHDMFVTYISAKEIANLYNKGRIRYRKETQRNLTSYMSNGTIIQTPTINNNSVEEIKEELLKGKFITNYITLNSIEEGTLKYDEKTGTLTIDCILDILDGFHRSMGMVRASAEGNIDYITGINITNYSVEKAQRFIVQEDKKNKMNKRFIKYLNKDNKANIIVKKINESEYSDLQGKIVTDRKFVRYGRALTLTDIMEKGINKYFNYRTMSDINKIKDYLIEGFNIIIGLYPQYFIDNVLDGKQVSVIAHEYFFIGYLYILSEIQDTLCLENELKNILSKIDFSINNPIWKNIGLFKGELTNNTINNLEKYLIDIL